MTHALRKAGWAPLLLATVGCALLAASYAHPHRAEVLPRFGGLALVFASGLIGYRAATATLVRDLTRRSLRAWREERAHVLLIALIVLTAVVLRAEFIDEPIRYDESYSFFKFVARPLGIGLTHYERATNHIFHTLLGHLSWLAFGGAPPALRLPAFLAGAAVVPAAYLTGRALYDRDTALLTAALVAPAAVLIEYSVNARGYTIVCLCFLLLLGLGAYLIARPNPAGWIVWAAIAAIGLYTTPIMVFGMGVAVAWMALRIALEAPRESRFALTRDLVLALVGAGLAALALYVPTLDQPGWSYEHPAHWGLLGRIWGSWNAGVPAVLRIVIAAGAGAAVLLHRRIGRQRVPVAAGVAALLLALLVIPRIPSYARMWLFLLPLYLMLAAAGVVALLRLAAPRAAALLAAGLAAAAVVGLGVSLRSGDLPNGGDPPLRDGAAVVRFLKPRLRPGERVVVSALTSPNFRYYFRREGLPTRLVASNLRWSRPGLDRAIVIVSRVRRETLSSRLRDLRRDRPSLAPPRLIKAYRWESIYELGL